MMRHMMNTGMGQMLVGDIIGNQEHIVTAGITAGNNRGAGIKGFFTAVCQFDLDLAAMHSFRTQRVIRQFIKIFAKLRRHTLLRFFAEH